MKKLIISFCALVLMNSLCTETVFGPEDYDVAKEAESVPWDLLNGQIVYSRSQEVNENEYYEMVFLLDADSRTVRLLRYDQGKVYSAFSWKKDGSAIACSYYNDSFSKYCIYSLNPNTGDDTALYATSERHQNMPVWSLDGRLAYWVNGMYENNYMGYGFFIDNEPFYFGQHFQMSQPDWSPDGLYLTAASSNGIVRISSSDATGEWLYTAEDDSAYLITLNMPVYSPDGSKVAFTQSTVYTSDTINFTQECSLWIINADGTEPQEITKNSYDWSPRWSPDGAYIAFIRSFTGSHSELMLINVTSGEEYVINKRGAFSFDWQ
jgi:Tol biopolymer transport system component